MTDRPSLVMRKEHYIDYIYICSHTNSHSGLSLPWLSVSQDARECVRVRVRLAVHVRVRSACARA